MVGKRFKKPLELGRGLNGSQQTHSGRSHPSSLMNYSLYHLSWVYSILGHTRWQQLSLLYSCLRVSVKIRALGSQWQTISLPPPKTPDPQKRRVCAPRTLQSLILVCPVVVCCFYPGLSFTGAPFVSQTRCCHWHLRPLHYTAVSISWGKRHLKLQVCSTLPSTENYSYSLYLSLWWLPISLGMLIHWERWNVGSAFTFVQMVPN